MNLDICIHTFKDIVFRSQAEAVEYMGMFLSMNVRFKWGSSGIAARGPVQPGSIGQAKFLQETARKL